VTLNLYKNLLLQKQGKDMAASMVQAQVVDCLPTILKVLGSIPGTTKINKEINNKF
jgi:hypothetical protein